MKFRENEAIYLQIADHVSDLILSKELESEETIPSVRELAINLEVNPNTVMRTYAYLEERKIIYNQRGIGYFVTNNAYDTIIKLKMGRFIDNELPHVFHKMELLQVSLNDLKELYQKFRTKKKGNTHEVK